MARIPLTVNGVVVNQRLQIFWILAEGLAQAAVPIGTATDETARATKSSNMRGRTLRIFELA